MDDLAVARALHVLAVVIWIGGVSMVTIAVLPSVRRGDLGSNRFQTFEAIERRFSRHARIATLIVGLSGLYIIARADLWDRFRSAEFWWMHAMVAIWLVFSVLLFVVSRCSRVAASSTGRQLSRRRRSAGCSGRIGPCSH